MRLPKDFRFDANEVRVRRHGSAVILEPVAHDWAWLDAVPGKLDENFARAARQHSPADIGISAIVSHELFYGAFKSKRATAARSRT